MNENEILKREKIVSKKLDEIEKKIKDVKIEFITDVPHNTVYEQDDEYIYRRNAIKVYGNKLSLIAGSSNSDSFLIKAGNNARISNCTADHGSEQLLTNDMQEEELKVRKIILKYGANSAITKKSFDLKYNKTSNSVIELLTNREIIKPIVSFRPIINLKYN